MNKLQAVLNSTFGVSRGLPCPHIEGEYGVVSSTIEKITDIANQLKMPIEVVGMNLSILNFGDVCGLPDEHGNRIYSDIAQILLECDDRVYRVVIVSELTKNASSHVQEQIRTIITSRLLCGGEKIHPNICFVGFDNI